MSWAPWVLVRRLPAVPRLLLASQLAFNVGFYLVVPFLAVHLAQDLALAGGVIGLVLGIRTFSQQGLFFLGGGLTDRFGVKPVVVTGCAVRIAGFCVLAVVESLAGVLVGVVLVGFAAALFSPAVESALADQGRRLEQAGVATRAEVFGLDAIASKLGSVTGPVLGALLLGVPFAVTCLVAAGVFVVVLLAHVLLLPRDLRTGVGDVEPVTAGWGQVLRNRRFLAFTACYCTYLLSYNQLYLALPVELDRATGSQGALGWLFVAAAVSVLLLQLPITARARRIGPSRALPLGFALMSCSFVVVAVAAPATPPSGPWALAPPSASRCCSTSARWSPSPSRRTWSRGWPGSSGWAPTSASWPPPGAWPSWSAAPASARCSTSRPCRSPPLPSPGSSSPPCPPRPRSGCGCSPAAPPLPSRP